VENISKIAERFSEAVLYLVEDTWEEYTKYKQILDAFFWNGKIWRIVLYIFCSIFIFIPVVIE
jgi:hypothetical protein